MHYTGSVSGIYGPDAAPNFAGSSEVETMTSQDPRVSGQAYPGAGSQYLAGPSDHPDYPAGRTRLPHLHGTVMGNAVPWWVTIAIVAAAVYLLAHKLIPGAEHEFGTPRVSLGSFWSIGVQALLFFVLIKHASRMLPVPGLDGLIQSA